MSFPYSVTGHQTQSWLGRFPESLAAAQQGLSIYRELKERNGEAEALLHMGDAQLGLNQLDETITA